MRRILETAAAFGEAAWAWWSDLAAGASWPPELGPWLLALVVLLLLAALRRRRPPPLEVRPPQLLITQGEVQPDAGPPSSPRRRRRPGDPGAAAAGHLTMTLSNLSRYPVQVLEVALRQESRGAPRVAELEAVVPPLGALELAARVPLGLSGDGWLDVYCYAAAPRQKLHRHRAELVWEPWVSRFKVAPMEQATAAAKRLASDERSAVFELPDPPAEVAVAVAAPTPKPQAAPVPKAKLVVEPAPELGVAPRTRPDARPTSSLAAPPEAEAPSSAPTDAAGPGAPRSKPATDATPLGALWARLPKGAAARGAAEARERGARGGAREAGERGDAREASERGDAREAGERGNGREASERGAARAAPEKADAPRRPKLEFPDEF